MKRLVEKVLKIYSGEFSTFVWVSLLLLFISAASMLLDNFSETVFIKRYGVKNLPNIYMINAVITFFLMNYIIFIQRRLSTIQLLRYLFIICSTLVITVRFLTLRPDIVYPLFYIFKTQFETLLLLLFWNLGNEIFNTRQAKRLFPTIMAADVLGRICGSAITKPVSSILGMDNIVFAYGALLLLAFGIAFYLERNLIVLGRLTAKGEKEVDTGVLKEFKALIPLARQSSLFKILAMVTLMANLMIPIFNYQFSFILDHQFASENGLLAFFSWFRSLFNGISLVMLLFAGRFFAFFGLTLAVLLHPLNYIVVFLVLLFHFKLGSAIYGRLSANVIRSVFNTPSLAAMMGLFPGNLGLKVRPLLRGTVVRLGVFGGSLILILTKDVIPAHLLSILGAIFGLFWFGAVYRLRRNYARIVIDHLQQDRVDFAKLEKTDLIALLKDTRIAENIRANFVRERGDLCVWYAELLRMVEGSRLKSEVLRELPAKTASAQRKLMELIKPDLNSNDFPLMRELEQTVGPGVRNLFLEIMADLEHGDKESFFRSLVSRAPSDKLKYIGLLGVLKSANPRARSQAINEFTDLIGSTNRENMRHLMRIVAKTGAAELRTPLLLRYGKEQDDIVKGHILRALHSIDGADASAIAREIIYSRKPAKPFLRKRALEALAINDEKSLDEAFDLLERSDRKTRKLILDKIGSSGQVATERVFACLSSFRSDVREWALEFVRSHEVSALELHGYMNNLLAETYRWVFILSRFKTLKASPGRDLISEKAHENLDALVKTILHLLELEGNHDDLRLIRRAMASEDKRLRYNAVEALENMISPDLAKRFIPLVDDIPLEEKAEKGAKFFPLPERIPSDALGTINYLRALGDPVLNECLTTYEARAYPEPVAERDPWSGAIQARPATALSNPTTSETVQGGEIAGDSLLDKIAFLRGSDLFSDMKISELAAIAAIMEQRRYAESEIILAEGANITALYVIFRGTVAVLDNDGAGTTRILEKGAYFGETSLFEQHPMEGALKAIGPCELFSIAREEFENLVDEFPRIALNMVKAFSKRLRELHELLTGHADYRESH